MNSSFGTTVARRPRRHSRLCLASERLEAQQGTNKFAERKTSSTTRWGLLKQPDNQKAANSSRRKPARCSLVVNSGQRFGGGAGLRTYYPQLGSNPAKKRHRDGLPTNHSEW